MAKLFLASIAFITAPSLVVAVQKVHAARFHETSTKHEVNESNHPCKMSGQLYFAHIMKDGGESVNDYMECLCDKHICSVMHNEGPCHYKAGVDWCEPTICTSHGMVDDIVKNCGPNFKNPKVFTVMRSPVSRIVSLYHFHKDLGHWFCVQNSLLQVLQIVHAKISSGGSIDHEWSDAMVDWYFANGEVISLVHGEKPEEELAKVSGASHGKMLSATSHDLDRAKDIIKGFDAIFFTDDLDSFPELFGKSDLPLSYGWNETCELGRVGAIQHKEATTKEIELIKSLNWADMELYEYARTLPNIIS